MGAQRVGQRIHVYWTDETAWFSGVVHEFSPSQGYYVVYDDGDERWEGPNESYRFDDGQQSDEEEEEQEADSQDTAAHEEPVAVRGATPRAMEPPESDDDGENEEEADHDHQADAVDADALDDNEAPDDYDTDDAGPEVLPKEDPRDTGGYPKPVVLRDDDNGDEEEERPHDDDDARSIALTEVPITYEPPVILQRQVSRARRGLPHRGTLRGVILSASNLPLMDRQDEPTAFARVAFVEAGSVGDESRRRQSSSLMLRCKQTLSATRAVPATSEPQWKDGTTDAYDHADGLFQLQVVPPTVLATGERDPRPAWSQLKGDLLFSVYHDDQDTRRSEFIGQASVPLHRLMRDVLATDSTTPCVSLNQQFPLETRQGKLLGGGAEIAVQFQFEPEALPDKRRPIAAVPKAVARDEVRPPKPARSTTAPSVASAATKATRPASAATRSRGHTSSSEINRRKFEKQLESENKAMAKRVAAQRREGGATAARRQQLNHQPPLTKSEPKPGVVAVATAKPRSHKASSAINRTKFMDQVKHENKTMGKRLVERTGGGPRRHADAKAQHDDLDWDDAKAQDKAYGADKRHVLRQQKDYLLEKAQAKYRDQSELVEDVLTLQTDVAEWKAKLFTVKSTLQRVDAMNTKDTHVRDCLRRAADSTKPDERPQSVPASSIARLEQLLDEKDGDDSMIVKHKNDLREQLRETETLENEQRRLEDELRELRTQQTALESAILEQHRAWQFVQSKRAFQTKMAAERANPARAAFAEQERRNKKQAMDWTAEEEEQYAIFQAQEQLTQLQIATTVLRDRIEKGASGSLGSRPLKSSSAACDYLRDKITKRKAKIAALEAQESTWRRQYEELVVNGEYEKLRAQAQELQHLLFLCESEAKHVAAAERVAKHSKDKVAMDLETQRFHEQTETEILLKSGSRNLKKT